MNNEWKDRNIHTLLVYYVVFKNYKSLKKIADFLNSKDLGLDYYRMFSKMKHPLLEVNQFDWLDLNKAGFEKHKKIFSKEGGIAVQLHSYCHMSFLKFKVLKLGKYTSKRVYYVR